MKMNKKWLKIFVEIKIRLDRGNSWVYWLRNLIILVAGVKIILDLNTTMTIITGILGIIAIYFLGVLDVRFLKVYQLEQKLITSKYNPHLNKISRLTNGKRT